ncbi:hypothetical protein M9Y10_017262, partial [Tritrichomonas musculus]
NEVQDRTSRELLICMSRIIEVPNALINNIMYVINNPDLFNEEAKEILDELKDLYNSFKKRQVPDCKRAFNDIATKFRDLNQYLIDPQHKIPDFSTDEFYKFLSTECGATDENVKNETGSQGVV